MIPQRITLEGFLSYGQRQEIDLSGLGLCMLSGPNGSGKSSVFDALTFALFGEHRKGKQDHQEVIHNGCDRAAVEFEFQLDAASWKIRRTLRRSGGKTRSADHKVQLSRWRQPARAGTVPPEGSWEVVPETSSHGGLETWVREHVGTSAAFACSVLLRQGEAERLLSSQPAERFKVLAGVVGLEHYQRLAGRAQERGRRADADVRALQPQLENTPNVSEEELQGAANKAATAAAAVQKADRDIEGLQELQIRAGQWAALQSQLRDAEARLRQHAALLKQATRIEADHRRLSDLKQVLPLLDRTGELRRRLEQLDQSVAALATRRSAGQAERARLALQIEQSVEQCQAVAKSIEAAHQAVEALGRQHADLDKTLAAAAPYEHSARELEDARRQIAALGDDPTLVLERANRAVETLNELRAALPALGRLAEHREKLATATASLKLARKQRAGCVSEIAQADAQITGLQAQSDSAETLQQQARDARTRAAAEVQANQTALDALRQAAGHPQCPTCGLPLTDDHLKQEEDRRNRLLEEANKQLRSAEKNSRSAESECRRLKKALTEATAGRTVSTNRLRDLDRDIEQEGIAITREASECGRAFDEAPETFRRRISPIAPQALADDWAATTWPAAADLASLKDEAKSLTAARRAQGQAGEVHEKWRQLTARAAALADTLARRPAEVPADLAPLRQELARLDHDRKAAGKTLADQTKQLDREQAAQRALAEQSRRLETEINAVDLQAAGEQAHRQHATEGIRQAASQLPEAWRAHADAPCAKQLATWHAEAATLESSGTALQLEQLALARRESQGLETQVAAWQADAARLPPQARQEPAAIATLLESTRRQRQQDEAARQESRRLHDQLEDARRRRLDLQQRLRTAERESHRYGLLAELLGRDRLQLHLLRRAERAIVDLAQGTLDRLSGGELTLQLRAPDAASPGSSSEDALSLEVIQHRTGGQALSVDLLSGSQKFRLAVSLALAIGQYAAGHRRSGESVIIDEGFGSLDAAGQAVMIKELHELKSMLKRIVLVSHQEAFADEFTEGYRFRLEDGETRVEKIAAV